MSEVKRPERGHMANGIGWVSNPNYSTELDAYATKLEGDILILLFGADDLRAQPAKKKEGK